MPRGARTVISNYPHHVIQRGHNRQSVFASVGDYLYYLNNLQEWKVELGCRVFAYCLMTNHVHLVIDPGEDERNLALLMKRISGRQTRRMNCVEKRTGTLWEGRFKSSPISTDEYLLSCSRYVELNPVRAGIVSYPEDYPWSSYREKVGLAKQEYLDFDPLYLSLASEQADRQEKYKKFLMETIPEKELQQIRQAIQRGQLTGGDRFVEEIAVKMGKRIEFRGRGRPRKVEKYEK